MDVTSRLIVAKSILNAGGSLRQYYDLFKQDFEAVYGGLRDFKHTEETHPARAPCDCPRDNDGRRLEHYVITFTAQAGFQRDIPERDALKQKAAVARRLDGLLWET